jgi:hypothetical protein
MESRSSLPLPFEEGEYAFFRKKRFYAVHIREHNLKTGRQNVLVCFEGVTYDPHRSPNFEIDEARVKDFYNRVVLKKRDLKTSISFEYKGTRFEEIHGDNQMLVTRQIPYEEDVAVYELAVETINELLLASKCAIKGLSNVPLFNEDYWSSLHHRDSWFYNFVPKFSQAGTIRRRKIPLAIGMPAGFFIVNKANFNNDVLPILKHRKNYVLDEMLVSANKAFSDGEYEASLVLLEAVFEAKIKECITRYYESNPFMTDEKREEKLDRVFQPSNTIRDLIRNEYPKCDDSKWFCEGVPEYGKWDKIYSRRNDLIHSVQSEGRLSKEEALKMFEDFREIFHYLFDIESSYR